MSLDKWTVGVEERRTDRRTRVLLSAAILIAGGDIPCTIRNLSATSAKRHSRRAKDVPDRFTLRIEEDGTRKTRIVRHREGKELGVQIA